jgi:23S rRNA pseudouridine1911/1915/1917 synthase
VSANDPEVAGERRIQLHVSADAAGIRLDRFLAESLGSRSRAQSLIEARRVWVDGRPRPKRHAVQPGEMIEVAEPQAHPAAAAAAPAEFTVVYGDEHLLVVDKPAGVVVHPARGHYSGTLAQALERHGAGGGEPSRAGIVHRLDRDTSGLLVVAKSEPAHRALRALLASRRLRREYLALVDGHPPARTGTVDAPLGRDRHDRVRMSIETDAPRDARTHFQVERLLGASALLRVVLETGRTHQIRAHMAAIGHPVCGDSVYGVAGRHGLTRQFLHAERLAFEHPIIHQPLDLRSPLPADLRRALELAEHEG